MDLAQGRAGGGQDALELEAIDHIWVAAEPEVGGRLGPHQLVTSGDHDRPHLALDELRLHVEVDRLRAAGAQAALAGQHAVAAALGLQFRVDAVLGVQCVHRGNRLREGNVDRLAPGQSHVELVRQHGGASLRAVVAAGAQVFDHEPRLLLDAHLEVADVAADLLDLRVGQHLHVGVPCHLHHQRRKDALRAVQGRECLREPGHVATQRWLLLD